MARPRWLACAALTLAGCARQPPGERAVVDSSLVVSRTAVEPAASATTSAAPDEFRGPRREMVERQLRANGIRDARVLDAMQRVPRQRFVPAAMVPHAYGDTPLPIGFGQTISQPFIVARMTELLELDERRSRVLEIGAGSGF